MEIEIYQHLESQELPDSLLDRLHALALQALKLIKKAPAGTCNSELDQLECIEISIIDDESIAGVHDEFMNDPSPTDVITFQHGEILISWPTTVRQAKEHGEDQQRELMRYIVHGLCHLHGYEDTQTELKETMFELQEQVMDSIWPQD